ncbi:FKBP-type peptidyl-prolyl cis-trans isomerase [Thermococcus peptonophilus]|uniref:FKBP-type peptidyl-prolyl cis-trans isomerase n=1 Tax=Thermococcus peptonophilus TaxID=53952 RepID=UPI000A7684AD
MIQGLDEQLEGLEVGKKYEIEVPPEKGFGKRDPKLIKTFTLGQFRRQGIIPFPGMPVEIETEGGRKLRGRVLTVSGGRVRVDFNHPYAGKHLVYEVEIVEKIEDPIEKVKALIELRLPRIDPNKVVIEVGEKDVVVDFTSVKDDVDKGTLVLGELLLEGDLKFLGYEEVKFRPSVDELLKPPETEEGEAAEREAGEATEAAEEREEAPEQEAAEEATEEKTEESVETEEAGEEMEEESEETSEKAEEVEEEKPKKSTKGRKTRRTTRKKSTTKKKAKAAEEKSEAEAENPEDSE